MATPFSDISIYAPIPHKLGEPAYYETTALFNFVSDLYVQRMNGYKPPKTTRITIQPAFHTIWEGPHKNGSIVHTAPFFSYGQFVARDKLGRYRYILDIIQTVTLQLSDMYLWDRAVFERAYEHILANDFRFRLEYPAKLSRDRKKIANIVVTKTETVTTAHVEIQTSGTVHTKKIFEKKNSWCYDCVYHLARHGKWFDNDRFGIGVAKGGIEMWYSLANDSVSLYEKGQPVPSIDFGKYFLFN
jgi:hypothetical protein